MTIRINLTSVPVKDQDQALRFYTQKLGFVLKRDIPMGGPRWLTVVSAAAPDGVELLLEPMAGHAPAPAYQRSLYDAGIPWTAFAVDDIAAEYKRLIALGVEFRGPPSTGPGPSTATFDDTRGNYIQLAQPPAA